MKTILLVVLSVVALSLRADPVKPGAGSHGSAKDALGEKLGTIRFEVSGNDAARAHVVRGVKLLHHMMYLEADREFARAVEADPACTLAHWGRAMAIIHPLWPDAPDAAEMKQGASYVATALAQTPRTARERAYLRPMQVYFRDAAQADVPARLKATDTAWSAVAEEFPDDLDAAAFSALFHLAPARFLPKDKSHRIQLQSGAIIQKILAQIPDHPGAQHYKIHAFDFPLLADRALEICDQYGAIAPDVPHALHMPTHIYTRRGQWEKSIEFNARSAEAARKIGESGGATTSHYTHALDYLVYAYLQRGQYEKADAIRRQVLAFNGPYHASNRTVMAFAFAAIPARCALERHDWQAAATLEVRRPVSFPWGDAFPYCESIAQFARVLGLVRTGQLDAARRELAVLEGFRRQIVATQPNSYWASQAETQVLTGQAWLALRNNNADEAVALMRRAAALEATTEKEALTPGEVLPAGELLGEMLLQLGRAADALAAYEAVLEVSPNRLNSLHGAARSAEKSADSAKAKRYHEQVVAVADDADADCEPLKQAKAFLAAKPVGRAE